MECIGWREVEKDRYSVYQDPETSGKWRKQWKLRHSKTFKPITMRGFLSSAQTFNNGSGGEELRSSRILFPAAARCREVVNKINTFNLDIVLFVLGALISFLKSLTLRPLAAALFPYYFRKRLMKLKAKRSTKT